MTITFDETIDGVSEELHQMQLKEFEEQVVKNNTD